MLTTGETLPVGPVGKTEKCNWMVMKEFKMILNYSKNSSDMLREKYFELIFLSPKSGYCDYRNKVNLKNCGAGFSSHKRV